MIALVMTRYRLPKKQCILADWTEADVPNIVSRTKASSARFLVNNLNRGSMVYYYALNMDHEQLSHVQNTSCFGMSYIMLRMPPLTQTLRNAHFGLRGTYGM